MNLIKVEHVFFVLLSYRLFSILQKLLFIEYVASMHKLYTHKHKLTKSEILLMQNLKKNILQMKCYDDVGGFPATKNVFPATKNVFPLGLNLFLARSALFLSLLLTTSIQEQKIIRLTFNYMCIYKKRNQNMYIYHFLRG